MQHTGHFILGPFFLQKSALNFNMMATTKKDPATKKNDGKKKQDDPCWDGYEQVGTKTKQGKKVPNCVPEKEKTGE